MTTLKQQGVYRILDVSAIRESKSNPRQSFDDKALRELASSIEAHGLLEPLLVRSVKDDKFEVIAGARRLRACRQLKLTSVPCLVRSAEDEALLELQLIENIQRVDLSALEEADAMKRLHEEFKQDVDAIAHKTGKSRATVYSRIKLADLNQAGRGALEKGRINASVALFIARLPERLQTPALRHVAVEGDAPALSFREAMNTLDRDFLRILDQGWDVNDAEILPEAGPCSTCPKRSWNIPGLVDELKSVWATKNAPADVCIDHTCFKKKLKAHFATIAEKADGEKLALLEMEKGNIPVGYLEVDDYQTKDRLREHKGPKPTRYAALDETRGMIREFYKASDLPKRTAADGEREKQSRAARARARSQYDTVKWQSEAIIRKCVEAEEGKRAFGENDLRVLLSIMAIQSRGIDEVRDRYADELDIRVEGDTARWILELPANRLPAVIVEALLRGTTYPNQPTIGASLKEAARCYGLDIKKMAALAKKLRAAKDKSEEQADEEADEE